MKDRLIKFLKEEGLTSAKLADIIKVQPSSISHILSGRNKPGFDFIAKVLTNFPNINAEWLIIGKGEMYKSDKQSSLFEIQNKEISEDNELKSSSLNISKKSANNHEIVDSEIVNNTVDKNNSLQSTDIEKIVLFYTDNTFKEYISNSKK
ncbi:helix-turn-helix domain-containing protein [Bacteroidota bacterium]